MKMQMLELELHGLLKITCFPRYRRPSATGSRRIIGSASSASLRSIKKNMIDCAISPLQEPTNTNPEATAVKTKTSSVAWGSPNIADSCTLSWNIRNHINTKYMSKHKELGPTIARTDPHLIFLRTSICNAKT
jgi:hypothetical protein